MAFLSRRYYVALLSAAELHGAAQRPDRQVSLSTRELTGVDLVEHPGPGGGIDNVATVLTELGPLDGAHRPVIPKARITHWAAGAPWPSELQVEQDLILSPLIVDIANHDLLRPEGYPSASSQILQRMLICRPCRAIRRGARENRRRLRLACRHRP